MTNIVLTATMQLVLAAFNQFAERAELDVPLPIQDQDITQVKMREREYGWCFMIVRDRHRFNWTIVGHPNDMRGRIDYDDLKYSTIYMDREAFLPSLTNIASTITTNEALQIAERCLQRLGYDRLKQYSLPPIVAQYTHQTSETDTRKPVPLFGIRWLPKQKDTWEEFVFQIQVSGITKKVTSFNQLTFEGNIVDLRQFIINSPPNVRAPTANAAPESPHIPQTGPP